MFRSQNPFTAELLAEFSEESSAEVAEKIRKLAIAQKTWAKQKPETRAEKLAVLAEIIQAKRLSLSRLITLEMGKPLLESLAEVDKCAGAAKYYSENAGRFVFTEALHGGPAKAKIVYEPLGVIFGVFPWNFPAWQVLRFAIPNLLVGNAVLIKHAPNVPQCALALQEIMAEAGLGDLYANGFIEVERLEDAVGNPLVKALTLTGSSAAGASFAALGSKYLKKAVLELGGSDPFIVFDDADLAQAAKIGVQSRFQNNGQSCIAAKRFIIHLDVYERFKSLFFEELYKLKQGDPMDEETKLTCLARPDLLEKLEQQVEQSISVGAQVITGGKRINDVTFQPTILENIIPESPAYHEELFGPVASFFSFTKIDEALAFANDSIYGLGATVWTENEITAKYISENLQTGMVYINQLMRSVPQWPFGGIKNSGYGRELAPLGMREFVNVKTVVG